MTFPATPVAKEVDEEGNEHIIFNNPGTIPYTIREIFDTVQQYADTEFKDRDGKVDPEANEAIASFQCFLLDQADIISQHEERGSKYDIKAAVTSPKEINKVLISSPVSDSSKLLKSKSIWDYTETINTDEAETLQDAIEIIKDLFENVQHSAKKLTNKETQQPIWKFVEPFFRLGMNADNPDFLKIGLYLVPDELFQKIIARRDLVMLIKNSEVYKKNRYLYNIAYTAQQKSQGRWR